MGVNIQTIKETRIYLAGELGGIYEDSEISALTNIIIRTVTGITKLHQLYNQEESVTSAQAGRIIEICNELRTGKPIQYILGETTFYDCTIRLNSSTLIPRPETEELVDLIIRENRGFRGIILDVGTGSGCIAIALATKLPDSEFKGIDISVAAIEIAKENAVLNNVSVKFVTADIFECDPDKFKNTGIIVSNPPYVRDSEKQFMKRNVLDFEPHGALFVEDCEPLKYYRAILDFAEIILVKRGQIYFEINEALGKQMVQLIESYGYSDVLIINDLNGKERIVKGTKNG
jgi:release factor glutamine methyltransferase